MLSVGALIMRPHPDGAVGSLARTARGGLAARTTPADRWASIIFVVCSLIILVVVPVSVAVQVRAMRHGLSEVDYPALAALNRLTVAVADESLAARATPGDAVPADSAAEQEQGALATLDALAPRLRGETAARYDRLRAIVGAWNRERLADLRWGAGGSSTDPHGIADPRPLAGGRRLRAVSVIAPLAEFDQSLLGQINGERLRILQMERLNVWLPIVLVPLALASMAVVFGIERRTLRVAADAEEGRLKLHQASEAREALARGVTHDLRNPLGAALSYCELLEEDIAGPLSTS